MTDSIPLVPLDEDSYYQDPLGFFARLRESRPVAPVRMPAYGRAWIVTRYADVRTVLTDPRLAKDDIPIKLGPMGGRLVAEVFASLLRGDPTSYLNADHRFVPIKDFTHSGRFGLAELINVALDRQP